ncbi:carbohydrate ABC transporter permease [Sanguibacter suaedae]|uniref:Carbohydrate ABC transporter permease n=1 Tax=Sanguibacter suaedae TaxID=2795737 RepID=A0A934ID21_9MICO|nr:carbohydrate ABC transporter permease [Sanguibacter suaedae]MBI9116122.1 carbohydrate ABC transporter permease [Sanguibacter suaedae]
MSNATSEVTRPLDTITQGKPPVRRRRRSKHRPAWEEPATPVGLALKGIALTIVAGVVLVPLYSIVLTSISSKRTISEAGGMVFVPGEITFDAYVQLINGGVVGRAALVSIGITVVGTIISTVVSAMAAYGLSRPGTVWHRPILFLFLITMFFGAGLIPTYLWVSQLGLIDSYWALILPGAVSAFNVLIMRNFFMGIDNGIIEAARIDGASDWRILWQIVMPISRAVTAVIALFYGVGYWNAFFNAVLYIRDTEKWPLQMVLRSYVLQGQPIPGSAGTSVDVATGDIATLAVKMAVMVLALVPVLLVYPFVQRNFAKGVIFGAIKG